jgi:hypothetical protein
MDAPSNGGPLMENYEFPSELAAELNSLSEPSPDTHALHLTDGMIASTLRADLARFCNTGVASLATALQSAPPAQVYLDSDHGAERLTELFELDQRLRGAVEHDLATLSAVLSGIQVPSSEHEALLRGVNRLRTVLVPLADQELPAAALAVTSLLLADLLEMACFVAPSTPLR